MLWPIIDLWPSEQVLTSHSPRNSTGSFRVAWQLAVTKNASEVIREGLRLLESQERDREAAYAALKIKLERGSAQADRGEFVDPDEVLKKIDERKRRRAAEKA